MPKSFDISDLGHANLYHHFLNAVSSPPGNAVCCGSGRVFGKVREGPTWSIYSDWAITLSKSINSVMEGVTCVFYFDKLPLIGSVFGSVGVLLSAGSCTTSTASELDRSLLDIACSSSCLPVLLCRFFWWTSWLHLDYSWISIDIWFSQ